MLKAFIRNIEKKKLFQPEDKLLVAVSGGIDSVVLIDLLDQITNQCAIAHCNFKLRGGDSEEDEVFVRELAHHYGIGCFVTEFETREYAEQNGISIEMAARELRYDWFEMIRKDKGFDYVLVAHHADDSLETFILNFSRGTGIRGLSGIKARKGTIIRPLLPFFRQEIEEYAVHRSLEFRLDASNNDTDLQRNYIRHEIIPRFVEQRSSFRRNLYRTIENLEKAEIIFNDKIKEEWGRIVEEEDGLIKISIEKLLKLERPSIYLFEFLYPFGFNESTSREMFESCNQLSGKQFFSKTHRAVVDRSFILISENSDKEEVSLFYIEEGQKEVFDPLPMELFEVEIDQFEIIRDKNIACLDAEQIKHPLLIRKWREGDYFRPLGMNGFKKVSDFFVDQKFSIPQKESTWILSSGNKIVWIIGHRIDDRFKVTETTKRALVIKGKK